MKSTHETVYGKTDLCHKNLCPGIHLTSVIVRPKAGERSGKDTEILKSSEGMDRWDFLGLSKGGKLRAKPSGLISPSVELWERGAVKQMERRQ